MQGTGFIALSALILLLLPVVILPWEGRRVPNTLYLAIAGSGLAAAGMKNGGAAVLSAAAVGFVSLLAVAVIVTLIRIALNVQILTSGHIKLLAAGSTWLGSIGTLVMICAAFVSLFGLAIILNRRSQVRRPDFSAIAALAILCVSIQQTFPPQKSAATSRSAPLNSSSHEQ